MKTKFILAAVILFLICTDLFSQTDLIVKRSSYSQFYVAENPSEKLANAASWKIGCSAVNTKDNTTKDNVDVVREAGIKTAGDHGTTKNVFFYLPLVIIYTVGQLLILFLFICERRFNNKNNPADIYTIADKKCLIL
ncbi:MAG: hypothetical protein A3F72_13340 [Bacteroidetes bacterium RIFCSPLOWO2_12_FULL_35_15]|nr:MAG: hypothetical protein A3F72_13340 [Bacteroidetes bacterium RIFCSPLOWO2_12_FULL_35_15]